MTCNVTDSEVYIVQMLTFILQNVSEDIRS